MHQFHVFRDNWGAALTDPHGSVGVESFLFRDHSGYGLSCPYNVMSSDWLSPYPEWSLLLVSFMCIYGLMMIAVFMKNISIHYAASGFQTLVFLWSCLNFSSPSIKFTSLNWFLLVWGFGLVVFHKDCCMLGITNVPIITLHSNGME